MKPRTLTAADRSALIKLASELPVGDAKRKAILAGLSKAAVMRYNYQGQLLTLAELARLAIGKDVFVNHKDQLVYNLVMDRSGDQSSVFKIPPTVWAKLRVPDLTSPRMKEKVLDARLDTLQQKLTQMRDRIEYNVWAKETGASKEERIAYLEKKVR